jgi:hypothetical protein
MTLGAGIEPVHKVPDKSRRINGVAEEIGASISGTEIKKVGIGMRLHDPLKPVWPVTKTRRLLQTGRRRTLKRPVTAGRAHACGLRVGKRHPHGRRLRTYATNVMGNREPAAGGALDAERARRRRGDERQKVYENNGAGRLFNEDDRLGGPDPYSNSKVCAELVTDTFRCCFFDGACCVATAPAGNVIGGGDWSPF